MKGLKILAVYSLIGSAAGLFFSAMRENSQSQKISLILFALSLLLCVFFLFIKNKKNLFWGLLGLYISQVFAIKTTLFNYAFSIGVSNFHFFAIPRLTPKNFNFSISYSDFSSTDNPQTIIGFNVAAVLIILFLLANKKRLYA